jgi:hypothetical protein
MRITLEQRSPLVNGDPRVYTVGMKRFWTGLRSRRGQTLTEYAVMTGVLLGVVAVAALFLYTFKEYGGRILDLVASEYP